MSHLTPEQIASYRVGNLSAEERRQAANHLADCDACLLQFKTALPAALIALADATELDELEDDEEHLTFEEIQEYIDGKASAALVDIIQVHMEHCTFCHTRVDDLSAFKAEVEKLVSSLPIVAEAFPAETSASALASVVSEVATSWRTRLLTFLAVRKTSLFRFLAAHRASKIRTGWLAGALMAGAAAALWIVMPRSGPKPAPSSDATNARLTQQTGHLGKERETVLRQPGSAKHLVQEGKKKGQPRVAKTGQGPGRKTGYTGVNTPQPPASAHRTGEPMPIPDITPRRMALTRPGRVPVAVPEPSEPIEHHRALPLSPATVQLNRMPAVIVKAPTNRVPISRVPNVRVPNRYATQSLSPSKFLSAAKLNGVPAVIGNSNNNTLKPIPPRLLPVEPHRDPKPAPSIAQARPAVSRPSNSAIGNGNMPSPARAVQPTAPSIAQAPPALPQPPPHREQLVQPPVVARNNGIGSNLGAVRPPAHRQHDREANALQTRDTPGAPFFYQELTRESLGDIKNVDAQDVAEGRVAPDGHIIITGAITDVWVPRGKYLELMPDVNIVGFKPVVLNVLEDNIRTQAYGLELAGDLPMIRIDSPVGGINRKRVTVVAADSQGNSRVLMQCMIRAHIANTNVADLYAKQRGGICSFHIEDNQALPTRHLYLGDICLGRMADKAGRIDIDERRLPPGKYTCQLIGKNEDGILIPGPSSSFEVALRYDITPANTDARIVIPEENTDAKLQIRVRHRLDVDIVKTQVYIAGMFAGEKEGDDFQIALPLRNVPDGLTSIEVIGIASDGIAYPVENLVVNLDNGAWRARIHNTAEWQRIQDSMFQIKKLDAEMHDWLKQAEFEPKFRHTQPIYTLKSITDHFATGKKGEYMGRAARNLTQMAQLQFECGNLYRKLRMLVPAKNMFYQVVRELGMDTIEGERAQRELNALTKVEG